MANWKYIKLGVASLAIVAVALGIGIGVSKNKANSSASSSSKAVEATAFQIDCGERRNLVVPGTEDYQPTAPSARRKLMRRKLIRRLGTESEISDVLEPSRTVDTTTSSKSSKSEGTTSKASKSEGPTSTKSSKSIEGCIPPSYVDKCTSKSGKSTSSTDGSRRELLHDISRELGKEAIPPPSIGEGRPIVSTTSSDGEIIISSKTSKATKSSKSQAPTTCASSKSSKSSSSSPSPRPSGGTDIIDTLTPTIFDTSTPTLPLIPASSNVPTPASVIPTPFPTSGGSQEGTPPFLSTTTQSPTSDSPTPNPSEPPSPFPTPNPVTPAPVTPFPTTPAPVTPAPTTPAPVTPAPTTPAPVTPAPTTPQPTTSDPTSFPTPELPTPSPSSGATPTVSTDITGPPTVPGRDGWP